MDVRRAADRALEQARSALARDEPSTAADHLASALSHAPALPEAHELLSRLAARADGGLDLFPMARHATAGHLAARAHLLAAAGRPEEGLPLLAAASGHTPAADWAGVPWVAEPALGVRIEPDVLAHTLMRLCTAAGDPAPPTVRPYLAVARHAVAAHPEHAMLLGAGSALARRIGETELAIDWAARGARVRPSKLGEIWLGYAYRSSGRLPEALAALRRAVAHDPDDLSVYADIAGTLAENGRLDDALAWVDRALERDPEYDCAVHTAHRLRFRADGDLAHLVRLADFIRDHPDESHEHTDLADCCLGVPWLGGMPAAAPLPRGSAPATTRPTGGAIRRLRQVAALSWAHPAAAYDAAVPLILITPDDLLALLAHPPADVAAPEVWACLGLLHHGAEEPWLDSARRRRLLALLGDGVRLDRTTEAAQFALIVAAWIDPAARADVADLVTSRLQEVASRPGARSMAELALATPGLDRPVRQLAAAMTLVPVVVPRQRARNRLLLRWRRPN